MTKEEFWAKIQAARDARSLTTDELCRLAKASRTTVEHWVAGLSAPGSEIARESVIRAVE